MDNLFTLREAVEKGITEFTCSAWPEGCWMEITIVGDSPYPRGTFHNNNNGCSLSLPLSAIPSNVVGFSFVGVNNYEEYEMKKLSDRIAKVKSRSKVKRRSNKIV